MSDLSFSVVIPGQPIGKARPRMTRTGHVYTPKTTAAWEMGAAHLMKSEWRRPPYDKECALFVVAVFQRPKRLTRKKDPKTRLWAPIKPDFDNVVKIVCDAIQRAGVVLDDKLVVDGRCLTMFTAIDEAPCVEISLCSAGDAPHFDSLWGSGE